MADFEDDEGAQYDEEAQKEMCREQKRMEEILKKSDWKQFSRPEYFPNPQEPIRFMQIECDYATKGSKIVLRMYGVTAQGNSLLVNVHNFLPFFYLAIPDELSAISSEQDLIKLTKSMNREFEYRLKTKQAILKIEVVMKENIRNFKGKGQQKHPFFKVYTAEPQYVAAIRSAIMNGRVFLRDENIELIPATFESSVPFALRFMIEKDIVGMGWVEIRDYKIESEKVTFCQAEINVDCANVTQLPTDQFGDIAPLRIFSLDIECASERGFPNEQNDPIIQIACIVKVHNKPTDIVRIVFSLLECEKIQGGQVKSYEKEDEMLTAFEQFFIAIDPDIILGYNIQNFDLPYIIKRAATLKIKGFGKFGRLSNVLSQVKDGKFMSKVMGMRDTKEITIAGRIQLDMMVHMMKDHKLSSFSLNNVCYEFLKQQKEDVHYSIIYKLWRTSPETRKRLALYCLKDAQLPILLMEKLCCIYNYSEMARVTGVPVNYLFMRGQQIKVASQILRKAKHYDYIMPYEKSQGNSGEQYQGAYVIEPEKGFYKIPIATLDFASLYPSIMMAHNICYCTLFKTTPERLGLEEGDFTKAPDGGGSFVKPSVRKGILPMILEDLINARKQARAQLAKETDPFKKAVLDGRQLALKVSANSVYGFTGAQVGQLPCLVISSAITGFGREMIKLTQKKVTELFSKQNNFDHDAQVIYGDTDSVMVKFGVSKVEEAMSLGKKAAEEISKCFQAPIKLEFEKVYYPYLLMNNKRYAGLYWTKPTKWDKLDTKGIESVRRDNCALVRKMVTQILDFLLVQQNEKLAVEYVQDQIRELYQNKIDISELVITKSLNMKSDKKKNKNNNEEDRRGDQEDFKAAKKKEKKQEFSQNQNDGNKGGSKIINSYKAMQAHVFLAEKMQKRDESGGPAAGDRIAYIIVQGTKGSKTYENAEDPVEVLIKDLPIDYDYYLNNQIRKPVERLFEYAVPNSKSVFNLETTSQRYIPKLNEFSFMAKFVKKVNHCMRCKQTVDSKAAICQNCEGYRLEMLVKHQYLLQELQQKYHQYWTTCQGCQGSLFSDTICANRDCEIYYKRIKVRRDLKEKQTEFEKLSQQDPW